MKQRLLFTDGKEEFFAMTAADIRLPDEVENYKMSAKSISKTYYYGDARIKKNGDIIWVEIATMGFLTMEKIRYCINK